MARAGDVAACPACRGRAQRIFTPPHLPVLAAGVRRALSAEEASAHEPRVVGEKRGRPMPRLATSPAPPWALSGH